MISIHALREEGDWRFLRGFHRQIDFYPRPPRGGRRWTMALCPLLNYFYPRPPRGGRPECLDLPPQTFEFLSTPSARRATPPLQRPGRPDQNFYPRPPRGGRLAGLREVGVKTEISIHALREEGDRSHWPYISGIPISIHALREEGDQVRKAILDDMVKFLSTPSARRATPCSAASQAASRFLSTPSARRATSGLSIPAPGWRFLSTPSARRAT